ncbi:MAG: hypothetical protein QXR17_08620 [Candidatus Bathyarchaeia archaeon]
MLDLLISRTKDTCSSYYFKYIFIEHELGPNITDIICLTESVKTLIEMHDVLQEKWILTEAKKRIERIFSDFRVEKNGYVYFKYTPNDTNKVVFNVVALVLESFSEFIKLDNNLLHEYKDYLNDCIKALRFLLKHQRDDGAWPYAYYFKSNKYYYQLDYHQGFIIDGLTTFSKLVDRIERRELLRTLFKGINFYEFRQFTDKGFSYYRYPLKYPIDIHN